MSKFIDSKYLLEKQYRDASNLNARIDLHSQFSANQYGWFKWVFDRFDLPPQALVLELGCGPGDLWSENRDRIPHGLRLHLSDMSLGMLRQAKTNLEGMSLFPEFGQIDAVKLPFRENSFDAVIANHMLYHTIDINCSISEIRRVLKTKGRLFASTIGESHMQDLKDLLSVFDPKLLEDYDEMSVAIMETFTLENGLTKLSREFSQVTMERYEDRLLVTEVEPLVAYVMSSMRLKIDKTQTAGLREYLQSVLTERNGVIDIGKDSGLFVAS